MRYICELQGSFEFVKRGFQFANLHIQPIRKCKKYHLTFYNAGFIYLKSNNIALFIKVVCSNIARRWPFLSHVVIRVK